MSPAWYSKLRLTTSAKSLDFSRDEFRGPRSDFVRQVALVTTTKLSAYCFSLLRLELRHSEERWEARDHPQDVLPQNRGGTEENRTVTCMVPKAKVNDRCKNLALSRDEFRGP
ncbi:hypothetical protein TNCV_39311 [Trichonephila clavipes]|nr:hypothetical protein TNCV_39311 [Trichonephila clavipes]